MEISPEDSLRLNVLLASKPQAIRIDESRMVVYGLTDRGESKVILNPSCKDEKYIRMIRELISGHVLGSPGGYPVYLSRWNRMGQAREESIDQMLMLGEPEAIVASVHASGISPEQAARAWWAMPCSENARRLLEKKDIVESDIGKELAQFLLEFLAFETEPNDSIESTRLILQGNLLSEEDVLALWKKSRSKTVLAMGFLITRPHDIPEAIPEREDKVELVNKLQPLVNAGNSYALLLLSALSAQGQTYLKLVERIMKKPSNQDVVNSLLDNLADYFSVLNYGDSVDLELEEIMTTVDTLLEGENSPDELKQILRILPDYHAEIRAMLIFSRLGYSVVRPVFSRSSAIGSLMRKKLEPVFSQLRQELNVLMTAR